MFLVAGYSAYTYVRTYVHSEIGEWEGIGGKLGGMMISGEGPSFHKMGKDQKKWRI